MYNNISREKSYTINGWKRLGKFGIYPQGFYIGLGELI
jgi:hypothetical protein